MNKQGFLFQSLIQGLSCLIPGNDGWSKPDEVTRQSIETLLQNPDSFQSLDFTALPSPLTHPDAVLRQLATMYVVKMAELPGNTTQLVLPITPDLNESQVEKVKMFNMGKYDR